MSGNLIFVSCGQLTEQEKALGVLLKAVIDDTPGFEAYFAEAVHDFEALGRNVFDALRRCVGALVVLHDRGIVVGPEGEEWGTAQLYGLTKNWRSWRIANSSRRRRSPS